MHNDLEGCGTNLLAQESGAVSLEFCKAVSQGIRFNGVIGVANFHDRLGESRPARRCRSRRRLPNYP
jgi:hypothetical protein